MQGRRKLLHELYGIDDKKAIKVFKHVAEKMGKGLEPLEVIGCYEGNEEEKLFCAWFVGVLLGAHTQLVEPLTIMVLDRVRKSKDEDYRKQVALDIAKDANVEFEIVDEVLREYVKTEGRTIYSRPITNEWKKSYVWGILAGVTLQASWVGRFMNLLTFLAMVNDMSEEQLEQYLKERKNEIAEEVGRDVV